MKNLKIVLGLLACAFLFGCTDEEKNLEGSWKLVLYEKNGVAQEIEDTTLNIHFEDKKNIQISGNAGVNNFYASVELSDDSIKSVSDIVTTKMAGSPEAMQFENEYLATLSGIDAFDIENDIDTKYLIITNSYEDSALKYEFVGSEKWIVEAVYTGSELKNISDMADKPYLIFDDDGKLSGSTGINIVNLNYQMDKENNTLTITEGIMTLKSGDDLATEIEGYLLTSLMDVTGYVEEGSNMALIGPDGIVLIQLSQD
jgi:heat shock protein HslJ